MDTVNRPIALARRVIDVAIVTLVLVVLIGLFLGRGVALTGRDTLIIGGRSMDATIPIEAAVIVEPVSAAQLRIGDVVTIRADPGPAIFTHRIVGLLSRDGQPYVETKGDANPTPDQASTTVRRCGGSAGRSRSGLPARPAVPADGHRLRDRPWDHARPRRGPPRRPRGAAAGGCRATLDELGSGAGAGLCRPTARGSGCPSPRRTSPAASAGPVVESTGLTDSRSFHAVAAGHAAGRTLRAMPVPPRPHGPPPTSSSSASRPRAAVRLLGPRRGDDGHPRLAQPVRPDPPHHDPSRAGRGVHGRRPRTADRPGRGRDGDPRPGGDEPRHRHRRCLPRPGPAGRDHRPGRLGQAPQGGPPARRHRPDVRAGDEVEHPGRADRRDPRDRPQGVPGGRAGEARADPHRAAREPRRDAARVGRRDAPARADAGLPARADGGGDRPRRPDHRRIPTGRSCSPATASSGGRRRSRSGRSPRASTSRSPSRSWARARSTTARTCR